MKAQVIYCSELKSGVSKRTGKPYEGYFVDLLTKEDNGDIRNLEVGYLDKSLLSGRLAEDTMIDLVFNRRGFPDKATVLPQEPPFMLRG